MLKSWGDEGAKELPHVTCVMKDEVLRILTEVDEGKHNTTGTFVGGSQLTVLVCECRVVL